MLHAYLLGMGMEPLIEVDDVKEMTFTLELGTAVIGTFMTCAVDMVKGRGGALHAEWNCGVRVYKEQGVGIVLVRDKGQGSEQVYKGY